MTMYHQYRDLPQIPSFSEDSPYAQWNDQACSGQARFHLDEDILCGGADGVSIPYMSTVERFLADQSFLSQSLLHPAAVQMVHNQSQCYEQYSYWPNPQLRYLSPDDTSVSGNSSYTTPNEVPSPHYVHTYGGAEDVTQDSLPYSTSEYSTPPHVLDVPLAGGSISLRDIEYEHEPEVELVTEDTEVMDANTLSPFHSDAAIASTNESSDTPAKSSLRDAESVQPMTKEEELSSDTEYTPSRANRRRRSSGNSGGARRQIQRRHSQHKRKTSLHKTASGRIYKKPNRTTASINVEKANPVSKFSGDVQRHFPCPLSSYGCRSNFSSKNEWKRHVSTQHIKLGFWRCDLCPPTVDPEDDQTLYHNDFNRKDLFTQHLRRMHAAAANSPHRSQGGQLITENNIADHQKRCFIVLRETPPQSKCLFCPESFSGPTSWDLRMEHIGRHLEKDRKTGGLQHTDIERWIEDKDLEQWLQKEGIISLDHIGKWVIGDGQPK